MRKWKRIDWKFLGLNLTWQRKQLFFHLSCSLNNLLILIIFFIISLTNDDGPNPKSLLSQASRRSKSQLNRIGVFTVSSLHGVCPNECILLKLNSLICFNNLNLLAFNCAKNPQPLEKLQKGDSFSADYIRELYSPSQPELTSTSFVPNAATITAATTAITTVTIQILLLTGEQRSLEVPSNWTSEQVMIDLFSSGPECREYFFRCSETGTILYRNDLVTNYVNHTLIVTPKVFLLIN